LECGISIGPVIYYKSTNSLNFSIIWSETLLGLGLYMKNIIFLFIICLSFPTFAQDENSEASVDQIEGLFSEDAQEDERQEQAPVVQKEPEKKEPEMEEISDLKKLETFDDIAVIQKRFLPKTKRFEFFVGGGTNLNDAFFVGNGVTLRLGYNFAEKFGVEGILSYIQNENRDVTNELLKRGVNTEGSVSTGGYYGVDFKWTPIYGKYAYFNEKIIPFDLYFTVGLGKTDPHFANSSEVGATQISVESPYTLKLGTGQIFAITKWMAFRWDIAMHLIQADTTKIVNSVETTSSQIDNNLFLNIGLSFFFPEASYR
jgi:outer membrane beta-barrel protein